MTKKSGEFWQNLILHEKSFVDWLKSFFSGQNLVKFCSKKLTASQVLPLPTASKQWP
jgi:hypothetical protein